MKNSASKREQRRIDVVNSVFKREQRRTRSIFAE